jgi:hypothetical protein
VASSDEGSFSCFVALFSAVSPVLAPCPSAGLELPSSGTPSDSWVAAYLPAASSCCVVAGGGAVPPWSSGSPRSRVNAATVPMPTPRASTAAKPKPINRGRLSLRVNTAIGACPWVGTFWGRVASGGIGILAPHTPQNLSLE